MPNGWTLVKEAKPAAAPTGWTLVKEAAPQERSTVDRIGDTMEKVAHAAEDFSIGGVLRTGVGRTAYNAARTLSRALPGDNYTLPESPAWTQPRNTAERAGQFVENAAEFAAPGGLIKRGASAVATTAPKLATAARMGLEGASAAGIAALQGNNPLAAGLIMVQETKRLIANPDARFRLSLQLRDVFYNGKHTYADRLATMLATLDRMQSGKLSRT